MGNCSRILGKGQTEKLSNAFIEKQVVGVAPVLSPGLYVVHGLGGIRDRKLFS